jgi:hypothetical protein
MNEANSEFLDPDLLKEAEATQQRVALSPEGEEMTTTRLPPLTPPPPPLQTTSVPPLPAAFPPPTPAPTFAAAHASTAPVLGSTPPAAPAPHGRPSWLHALLTTTFPPPGAVNVNPEAPIRASTAGTVFAVLGLVFAVVALVTGLRGAPTDPIEPVVAAATVIARALLALGAGALSFAMLRQAERLLVQDPPSKS